VQGMTTSFFGTRPIAYVSVTLPGPCLFRPGEDSLHVQTRFLKNGSGVVVSVLPPTFLFIFIFTIFPPPQCNNFECAAKIPPLNIASTTLSETLSHFYLAQRRVCPI